MGPGCIWKGGWFGIMAEGIALGGTCWIGQGEAAGWKLESFRKGTCLIR